MAGKFAWGLKTKRCLLLSTKFGKQKVCWHHPAMFCLITSSNFPANDLNFHWRWRWWDWIQAIFLNIFYFNSKTFLPITKALVFKSKCWFCFCVGVASVLLGKIKLKFSLFFKSNIFCLVKFIYSEKATKFCEIFTLLLSYVVLVKKGEYFAKFCGVLRIYELHHNILPDLDKIPPRTF